MDIRQRAALGEDLSGLGIMDAHAHLGPLAGIPRFGDPSTQGLVRVMDRAGIGKCLCSALLAVGPDFEAGNDMVEQAMRESPDRILGLCVIDPNHPEAIVPELEKRMARGFVGVKIHPYNHRWYADSDRYRILYEHANARGLIVKSHTYSDGSFGNAVCNPLLFDELAGRYPKVTFILGHAGGAPRGHEESIAVARKRDNVYLELCSTLAFTSYWLKRIIAGIGDERVFYGSDMPVYDPRAALGIVLFADIPDASKERILGLNLKRLLERKGSLPNA